MLAALEHLGDLQEELQIVHQTGEKDLEEVRKGYLEAGWKNVEVQPFIKDMSAAYARASLVVCRAGATTLAELTACGRTAILVPFPYAAGGHQSLNAQALAAKGAALLMEEADLTPNDLALLIMGLLNDRKRLKTMSATARSLARPGAAQRLLHECRQVIVETA
jgi:UDP-N-acetylglucosamine--N-acetylmuramyl-(pentapeptide) pyrophosphoryl-undecaprenol N-acetylglucosamine transferase